MKTRVNLKNLSLDELEDYFRRIGELPYRARQLMSWMYNKKVTTFAEMTNFSLKLREYLEQNATLGNLKLIHKEIAEGKDTVKYLFALEDKEAIESVIMIFRDDKGRQRLSLCISTQVGCAMGCTFCASGKSGFKRNLEPWEIVDQYISVHRDIDRQPEVYRNHRINNIVFMGIGEPLLNYQAVMKSIRLLNSRCGANVGMRHITISTCGIPEKIKQLAEESLPLQLAISLHSSQDELRDRLMPVNKRYPLEQLMEACRIYQAQSKKRITFEYILIDKLNDSEADAKKLSKLLAGINCLVNLIPLNPIAEFPYQPSVPEKIKKFKQILEGKGIKVTQRQEKGKDINAACGQLRRKVFPYVTLF